MSLNAFKPRCRCVHSQFLYRLCTHATRVHNFWQGDKRSCQGYCQGHRQFPLYDKAHKDEGKVATSDMLMTATAYVIGHC